MATSGDLKKARHVVKPVAEPKGSLLVKPRAKHVAELRGCLLYTSRQNNSQATLPIRYSAPGIPKNLSVKAHRFGMRALMD